jgi:hypothetical protein
MANSTSLLELIKDFVALAVANEVQQLSNCTLHRMCLAHVLRGACYRAHNSSLSMPLLSCVHQADDILARAIKLRVPAEEGLNTDFSVKAKARRNAWLQRHVPAFLVNRLTAAPSGASSGAASGAATSAPTAASNQDLLTVMPPDTGVLRWQTWGRSLMYSHRLTSWRSLLCFVFGGALSW